MVLLSWRAIICPTLFERAVRDVRREKDTPEAHLRELEEARRTLTLAEQGVEALRGACRPSDRAA